MEIPYFAVGEIATAKLEAELETELGVSLRRHHVTLPEFRDEIKAQLAAVGVPQLGPVAINASAPAHVVEKVRRLGHPVVAILGRREAYLLPGLLPAEQGSGLAEVWPEGWASHPWAVWSTVR